MKLTKAHLKTLIKEELDNLDLDEGNREERKIGMKRAGEMFGSDTPSTASPTKMAAHGKQVYGKAGATLRKGKTAKT